MPAPNEITPAQLSRLIGTPECPVLIDVRIASDFDEDPRTLPTARRQSHLQIDALATELMGKRAVVICHKGLKLSQGSAAILRTQGIACEVLKGGHVGWTEAGLPLAKPALHNSLWVTKHRPKIDRIACPWLIRRFIDPAARFLFVAPSEVGNVAEKFQAISFDMQDSTYTHQGDQCTFDAIMDAYGLSTPALDRVARIVRAADTDTLTTEPEAAGLLALSLGLSRMYRDDLEQLDHGLHLYDALYRWARDATHEAHTWEEG